MATMSGIDCVCKQRQICLADHPNARVMPGVPHILGIEDNAIFGHPCGPVSKEDYLECFQGQKFKDSK